MATLEVFFQGISLESQQILEKGLWRSLYFHKIASWKSRTLLTVNSYMGILSKIDFALSLGVTTPLKTLVMGISWWQFWERMFWYDEEHRVEDLVRRSSISRRSDGVYLGWFVWNLVGRLSKVQALRRSVKVQQGPGPFASFLTTWFQVYLSKCWDPYVSPGCMIRLAFFWVFLPCFSMLILSLPPLGLGSKSTCLSPGFCVCRPRQYNTICWKLGLFVFFSGWLFEHMESINVAGV